MPKSKGRKSKAADKKARKNRANRITALKQQRIKFQKDYIKAQQEMIQKQIEEKENLTSNEEE